MGKYDLWLQEMESSASLAHQPEYVAIDKEVSRVYSRSGLHAALHEWAEQEVELSKRRYEDPAFIGYIYAAMDDKDQAFAWLEKG
jgi:hypothetical protein